MSPNSATNNAPNYWERLVSALSDGVLIVDSAGSIRYANGEAERIFGRSASELVGQPFSHPTDTGPNTNLLIENPKRAGVSVEMRIAKGAWKDSDAWVVSLRDMTARAEIENIKRINEIRVLAAGHGVVLVDMEGRFLEVNDGFCRITGYTRAELLNKPFQTITHPDDIKASEALSGELLAGRSEPYELNKRYIHKNGHYVSARINVGIARDPVGKPICFVGHVQDTTEEIRAKRALKTLSAALRVALIAARQNVLVQSICDIVVETGGYRVAWVGVAEQDKDKSVRVIAKAGVGAEHLDGIDVVWADVPQGRGPTGTAIRTGLVQVSRDFGTNAAMSPWREIALQQNCRSCISIPLKRANDVIGAMTIYSTEPFAFGEAEANVLVELVECIIYQLSVIEVQIEKERISSNLRRSLVATIEAISATLEMRDPYTSGHQHRVAALSYAMANEMGVPAEEATGIYFAAMVHDVGKINMPAEILNKPGPLSKIEMSLIRTHSQSGHNILKGIDFPWPVAQMVLQHHERLDGSGYPNGLKRPDLLRGALILAVADVAEAMMTHRPYRPAWSLDDALREIEKNKGTLYDAAAVDACVVLFRSGAFSFGQENRPPIIA